MQRDDIEAYVEQMFLEAWAERRARWDAMSVDDETMAAVEAEIAEHQNDIDELVSNRKPLSRSWGMPTYIDTCDAARNAT